jgi:hypothetical protein
MTLNLLHGGECGGGIDESNGDRADPVGTKKRQSTMRSARRGAFWEHDDKYGVPQKMERGSVLSPSRLITSYPKASRLIQNA